MPDTSCAGGETGTRQPRHGGGSLFWLLALMGLATFAPCIILPQWRQYQALDMAAQVEQHRLEVLQGEVERERRLLQAIRSDPAVIARLAQRELKFQRVNSQAVLVAAPPTSPEPQPPFEPTPPEPPAIVARAVSFLPDFDYDRVFRDDESRPVIMAMSVALIGVAFWLFGRRSPTCG